MSPENQYPQGFEAGAEGDGCIGEGIWKIEDGYDKTGEKPLVFSPVFLLRFSHLCSDHKVIFTSYFLFLTQKEKFR